MVDPLVPALSVARYAPSFPCYVWNGYATPTGLPPMWLRFPSAEAAYSILPHVTHWLPIDCDPQIGLIFDTPNAALPPLDPTAPRRKMLVEIEVAADFEKRLDNQWMVEREINADRWSWKWVS